MRDRRLRLMINNPMHVDAYEVRAGWQQTDGSVKAVSEVSISTEDVPECGQLPSVLLGRETLLAVFNQRWGMGFRPADGTGDAGHLGSIKDHLVDIKGILDKVLPAALGGGYTEEG